MFEPMEHVLLGRSKSSSKLLLDGLEGRFYRLTDPQLRDIQDSACHQGSPGRQFLIVKIISVNGQL